MITDFSEYKGQEYVQFIEKRVTMYKGYTIQYFIVGINIPRYNENEFFNVIKTHNIHCLLALNKWG